MFKKGQKVRINQESKFEDGDEEIVLLPSHPVLEVAYDNGKGRTLVSGSGITMWLMSWRLEEVK